MSSLSEPILDTKTVSELIVMPLESKQRLREKVIAHYRATYSTNSERKAVNKLVAFCLLGSLLLIVYVGMTLGTLVWGQFHIELGLVIYLIAFYLCCLASTKQGAKHVLGFRAKRFNFR